MEQKDFAVTDLTLDKQNPRHDAPTSTTREAISALLATDPDKWVNLAQDIASKGLNPTELTIVVQEEGDMVAIEGNRRISALKALLDSTLAAASPGLCDGRQRDRANMPSTWRAARYSADTRRSYGLSVN